MNGSDWLTNAIADGLVEWAAVRASAGISAPSEREQEIYRLGFASGADAGIKLTCDKLAAYEEEFCGCCGRAVTGELWCADCSSHVGMRGELHTRTHFAQSGSECPYQSPSPLERIGNHAERTGHRRFASVAGSRNSECSTCHSVVRKEEE